jgi:hypothetical protein
MFNFDMKMLVVLFNIQFWDELVRPTGLHRCLFVWMQIVPPLFQKLSCREKKNMATDKILVSYGDCVVRASDRRLLQGAGWLNDRVIGNS